MANEREAIRKATIDRAFRRSGLSAEHRAVFDAGFEAGIAIDKRELDPAWQSFLKVIEKYKPLRHAGI